MKKNLFLCLISFLFFGCASLQTDVYIDQISYSEDVMRFEKRFAELDAKIMEGELTQKLKNKCSSLIADIEVSLADISLKKSSRARLSALEGLSYLLLDNSSRAAQLYEKSLEEYKGDARGIILASRLGTEKNLEKKLSEVTEPYLLKLEMAIRLYREKNYLISSALFDEAFLSLDEFYRAAYKKLRDEAWEFKKLGSDGSSELIKARTLTVAQMLVLVNEESELLYNYSAAKSLSENDLYKKISAAGLLDCVPGRASGKKTLAAKDTVTKYAAARFLWNLYNVRKNSTGQLTKYSVQYTKFSLDSPVADVSLDNADFDAVLGCVEKEIINLEDGRNFAGTRNVSGSEMASYIKKIK